MEIDLSDIKQLVEQAKAALNVMLLRWVDPDTPEGVGKIVSAILALRNHSNGGYLGIGFDRGRLEPDTENVPKDVKSAFHIDKIDALISCFASEPFGVTVRFLERDGQLHPVIVVPPGKETLVKAKRDLRVNGKILIGKGDIYLGSVWTHPVESYNSLLKAIPAEDLTSALAPRFMRCMWSMSLEPDYEKFLSRYRQALRASFVEASKGQIPIEDIDRAITDYWSHLGNVDFEDFRDKIGSYQSFEEYVEYFAKEQKWEYRIGPFADFDRELIYAWTKWRPRIAKLTPKLIISVREIYSEYIQWLKKHPDAIEQIAWEAFEKLIAEIFASRGFHVDLTGRLRNRSADIIAVRTDEFGVEIKYLIECKRYRPTHKIGLDIVNGVIGAARRANVDHAFLVTTSFFSSDVEQRESELKELRLHIRDGDDVRQWLRDYAVRTEHGLWLAKHWDEII